MSVDQILRSTLVGVLAQFVPTQQWFTRQDEAVVWVSAYRVFRVPLDGRLASQPIILDFGQIRAVFIHASMPYPNLVMGVLPNDSGTVKDGSKITGWETTGDGNTLLLITPFPAGDSTDASPELRAWERIEFIRAVLITTLGRNTAFESMFEVKVELSTGNLGQRAIQENPMSFPPPDISVPAMNHVFQVSKAISALDQNVGNRVRLALRGTSERWVTNALTDQGP